MNSKLTKAFGVFLVAFTAVAGSSVSAAAIPRLVGS
jgi:hypothetical protein